MASVDFSLMRYVSRFRRRYFALMAFRMPRAVLWALKLRNCRCSFEPAACRPATISFLESLSFRSLGVAGRSRRLPAMMTSFTAPAAARAATYVSLLAARCRAWRRFRRASLLAGRQYFACDGVADTIDAGGD